MDGIRFSSYNCNSSSSSISSSSVKLFGSSVKKVSSLLISLKVSPVSKTGGVCRIWTSFSSFSSSIFVSSGISFSAAWIGSSFKSSCWLEEAFMIWK